MTLKKIIDVAEMASSKLGRGKWQWGALKTVREEEWQM